MEILDRKVTRTDLCEVLYTMHFYNQKEGFMAFVGHRLVFFNSEPSFGGAPVTTDQLKQWIQNIKEEENEHVQNIEP